MKLAIIGSRKLTVLALDGYVSGDIEEIVSGGAKGVDACAAAFAQREGLKLTEFLPKYDLYGRAAPIIRNQEIVNYADKIIAFWDGSSKGTLSVIQYAKKIGKECEIVICN